MITTLYCTLQLIVTISIPFFIHAKPESPMSLELEVALLTQASTELLKSVNVQKSYLDAAAKAAIEGVTAQGAIAPTPGKSPVGDSRGKFPATWLDPEVPITSTYPLAVGITSKFGYNFTGQNPPTGLWHRIATLAADAEYNAQHLRIDGVLNDNWAANACSPFVLILGVRGGFYFDATFNGVVPINTRIAVFQQTNGTFEVYLHFRPRTFGAASFNMLGYATTTYAQPVSVTAIPDGTVVYDTGDIVKYPPRWKGASPGVGTSFNSLVEVSTPGAAVAAASLINGGAAQNTLSATQEAEVLGLGVSGTNGVAYAGRFGFMSSAGDGSLYKAGYRLSIKAYDSGSIAWTGTLFSIKGNGQVYVPVLKAGTTNTAAFHEIVMAGAEGTDILQITGSVSFRKCDNNWGNLTNAAMIVQANGVTNRSSNNKGTVNTMGNDYAEYIFKCHMCGIVAPGQIVGISADNKITDQWADAVMFSIKSTAPSFVGGDSWANNVGPRPSPQAGMMPEPPVRREVVITQQSVLGTNPPRYEDVITESGDTDDEWAEKLAAFEAALATHEAAVKQDAEAMANFDAALEVERQKVDRIAIAGRVPVNVQGAQPGDYIVPVQDGDGIKGIAVPEDSLNMKQYFRAVGRVISIEPDGRAYVMVKVV